MEPQVSNQVTIKEVKRAFESGTVGSYTALLGRMADAVESSHTLFPFARGTNALLAIVLRRAALVFDRLGGWEALAKQLQRDIEKLARDAALLAGLAEVAAKAKDDHGEA